MKHKALSDVFSYLAKSQKLLLGQVAKTVTCGTRKLIPGQVRVCAYLRSSYLVPHSSYLRYELRRPAKRSSYLPRTSYLSQVRANSYLTKLVPGKLIPHT